MNDPMLEDNPPDKLYEHHRQQLSAMLDGALSPDAARFMLRRLQHDTDLASCWERWQVCGDVLRGQRHALLPADFAQLVARAIAIDSEVASAPLSAAKPRWAVWSGGAALAASVAAVALFIARQSPEMTRATPMSAPMASTAGPASAIPSRQVVALPTDKVATTPATGPLRASVAAVAIAAVPRRLSARRQHPSSATNPAAVQALSHEASVVAVANPTTVPAATASANHTFADPTPLIAPARAWPRAVLPGLLASDALSVDYSTVEDSGSVDSDQLPPFHPFEPKLSLLSQGSENDEGTANVDAPQP